MSVRVLGPILGLVLGLPISSAEFRVRALFRLHSLRQNRE